MKITIRNKYVPVKVSKRGRNRKGKGSPGFNNRQEDKCYWQQKPQSPIRELKDMTEEERQAIRERLESKNG